MFLSIPESGAFSHGMECFSVFQIPESGTFSLDDVVSQYSPVTYGSLCIFLLFLSCLYKYRKTPSILTSVCVCVCVPMCVSVSLYVHAAGRGICICVCV